MKTEHLVRLALLLLLILIGLGAVAMFYAPVAFEAIAETFEPGLDLKTSVVIGFVVSVVLISLFAVVAGDSFFGELEAMVTAFLLFFVIFSLTVAWVF